MLTTQTFLDTWVSLSYKLFLQCNDNLTEHEMTSRFTFAASVILVAALAFIAPINPSNSASAQTDCVQVLSTATVEGHWSTDCPSRSRDSTYARFYTFTLDQEAEVTITLESDTDPYLYLLDDSDEVIADNDDIDYDAGNLNSRLALTLDAGSYTIEATTYDSEATGDFTLIVSGIDFAAPGDDRAALTALYHATNGDNWRNNTNWLTDAPLEDWDGVTTNGDGRVTELDFQENNLSGPMPPEIGNLVELTSLWLRGNRLTGTVPPELGNLTQLENLLLDDNRLWGELPRSMTALTHLYLFNSLNNSGLCAPDDAEFQEWLQTIPPGFAQFHICIPESVTPDAGDLAVLTAFYNATDGDNWDDNTNWLSEQPLQYWAGVTINSEGRVTRLSFVGNNLSGRIPSQLGNLSALEWLRLDYNQLTGSIPAKLGNLISLEGLILADNQLSDTIPVELGNLSALEWLILDYNQLTGEIPAELGNLADLERLLLEDNQLLGAIPPELGDLDNLSYLDLSNNQLTGNIPAELGNLTSLLSLDLNTNQLTGPIQSELARLSNLRRLSLRNNQLTGQIPSELRNLTNLYALTLNDNQLTGEIPPELGNLINLEDLWLDDNQLTGSIPSELTNLHALDRLYLAGNQLTGCVPAALRDVERNDLDHLGLPNCGNTQPPTPTLPACVESLPSDMTVSGTWSTDCTSSIDAPRSSGDRYARFYTFSLDAESDVTIDLSSDKDTYLYLRSGASTDGTVTHENDDRATDNYDSMIEERLDPGTYTVEATTYAAGVTGSFTLAVTVVPVPDTTELEPPPGPAPDPTTLIPESCALQSFSGTSVNDSWTSDCVSQNRTENGAHYAKFFSFSVSRSATYDITLVSRTDPYLILLDSAGDIIDSDDDDDNGLFNLGSRNSGIRIALDPGDYIFEATTYAGSATGEFTLTILRPELVALRALYNATDGAN